MTPHAVAPSPERVAKRLMRAQRHVSGLLHRIVEGQPEWQVRTAVLEECARLVEGDVALLDIHGPDPLLGRSGTDAADWWLAAVDPLAASTDSSLLLDTRTVALRLPGSGEHLLARAPHDMPALDAFLLEPLVDLLAMLRQSELLAVRAALRAREDPLTGLPNAFALHERLRIERRASTTGSAGVALVLLRLEDADLDTVHGSALPVAAAAVSRVLREGDMVAHLGCATFAVLCPGAGPHEGAAVADRLRLAATDELCRDLPGRSFTMQLIPSVEDLRAPDDNS